jgi:hypothetical protein
MGAQSTVVLSEIVLSDDSARSFLELALFVLECTLAQPCEGRHRLGTISKSQLHLLTLHSPSQPYSIMGAVS